MLNTSARLLLASVAAGSLVTLSSAPALAYDHLLWAYDFIDNQVVNDYGTPCSLNFDTYVGKVSGACFLTQLLKQSQGYAGIDFDAIWDSTSPGSGIYYDAVVAQDHFIRITNVSGLQTGDIWVLDKTATYGGHLMIISATPVEITHQILPIYAGTRQWKVPVVDATSTAHGCTDTRFDGTCNPTLGTMDPGVGEGNARVYTDLAGAFLGHTWSVTKAEDTYKSPLTRPQAFGRLNGLPDPIVIDPPPPPPPGTE